MANKGVRRTKLTGCPRCGGRWAKRSGFIICSSCGHVAGSQSPSSEYEANGNYKKSQPRDYTEKPPIQSRYPTGRRDQPLVGSGKR